MHTDADRAPRTLGPSNTPDFSGLLLTGITIFGLIMAFTMLGFYIYGLHGNTLIANSDLIQPYLVMHDALLDPSSLLDWIHSPALYAFPDWLIAGGLVQFSGLSNTMMPIWATGILMTSYAVGMGLLLSMSGLTGRLAGTVVSATAVLAMFAFCEIIYKDVGVDYTQALGGLFIHTGSIVTGLLFCSVVCHVTCRYKSANSHVVALGALLAFVGAYSDPVILPWFILPGIALGLLVQFFADRKIDYINFAMLFGAAMAGAVLDRATRHFPVSVPREYSKVLGVWWHALRNCVRNGDWLLPIVVVLSVVMLVRGVKMLKIIRRNRQFTSAEIAELLLIACTWAALLMPSVTGALVHQQFFRYSLPMFLLPHFWLVFTLFRKGPQLYTSMLVIACIAVWIIAGAAKWDKILHGSQVFARAEPSVACIEDAGLKEGYAAYWQTKKLMWESDYALHLYQLTGDIKPYVYNYNTRWFTTNAASGKPIHPNFILARDLDPDKLRATFGTADEIKQCGDQEVWIYKQELSVLPYENAK